MKRILVTVANADTGEVMDMAVYHMDSPDVMPGIQVREAIKMASDDVIVMGSLVGAESD